MVEHPTFPYEDLQRYPTADGIVADMRIEEFHGWRTRYFEFAIYLQDGRRFFTRRPDRGEAWATLGAVNKGSTITLSFVDDPPSRRGQRIVNLIENGETVYSFEQELEEQAEIDAFVRRVMQVVVGLGCLFFLISFLTKPTAKE